MKNLKEKGISNYAKKFHVFGIKTPLIGIITGTIKERRLIELLYGLYCFMFYRPSIPKIATKEHTPKKILTPSIRVLINNHTSIVCRANSIQNHNNITIAGEYGWPGSRIIYKSHELFVHEPYKDDANVYHIHSITHLENDYFLVATGDTAKYLDIVRINDKECTITKRLMKYTGGFTASIKINDDIWFGTDFSFRPNYLYHLNNKKKYFLPKEAYTEYIISIQQREGILVEVVSKMLLENKGHLLIFNTKDGIFDSIAPVEIFEYSKIHEN